jgi:hypothetical protein
MRPFLWVFIVVLAPALAKTTTRQAVTGYMDLLRPQKPKTLARHRFIISINVPILDAG